MRSGDFQLSRRASIILPRGWHWRVDMLDARGTALQLLTAYNPRIEDFRAWLGWRKTDGLLVIIARLEFHGTHPGWHCHSACCDISEIEPGQPLHRQFVRLPKADHRHRKTTFGLTEASALAAAFGFYRLTGTPEGMFL
jgi:hypothetical protein